MKKTKYGKNSRTWAIFNKASDGSILVTFKHSLRGAMRKLREDERMYPLNKLWISNKLWIH